MKYTILWYLKNELLGESTKESHEEMMRLVLDLLEGSAHNKEAWTIQVRYDME